MSNPMPPSGPAPDPSTGAPGAAPVPGAAPGQPANPKRRQKIVLVVFLVVVLGFFGLIFFVTRNSPNGAKAGDCLKRTGEDAVEVIACTDAGAEFKVVGRVEDKTQVEASLSACDAFPDAEQSYWSGELGKTGYVLCLAKNG